MNKTLSQIAKQQDERGEQAREIIDLNKKQDDQLSNLTNNCAFCNKSIKKNFYNACKDCYKSAVTNPEAFAEKVLA